MLDEIEAARAYDAWFDDPWGAYAFRIEANMLLRAIGAVAGRTILDAGCGTGRFGNVLLRKGARPVGLDLDDGMLSLARGRLSSPLVRGDGLRLPFKGGVFDLAAAVTLCEFVEQPEAIVSELARVVRRPGRVVLGALNPQSLWGAAHRTRFRRPPWSAARFLSWNELLALGTQYGNARVAAGLYAFPGIPALNAIGPIIERFGKLSPRFGAFRTLTIELPSDAREGG
jgi:SAM-dependent methyltransferase